MLPQPSRYLLLTEGAAEPTGSAWRFVLCHQSTGQTDSVSDVEPTGDAGRMALLALVRGLEAIPVPSQVTVITPDRHVRHGIEGGIAAWQAQDWKWERFGRLVTVRDHDLWQRVAQALEIHRVACRSWRLNLTDHTPSSQQPKPSAEAEPLTPAIPECPQKHGSPADLNFEPALLVVRRPKRVLRFDQASPPATRPHTAAACVG